MQSIPVFVVSLVSSSERRAAISSHLYRLGIEYKMIDAVDGTKLDREYINKITQDRPMHLGGIGCYLSHLLIYEKIVRDNIPVSVILEDDAALRPKAVDLLRSGCNTLDFDYCFLDCEDRNECGSVFYDLYDRIDISKNIRAYALSSGPQGTHAYMITLQGARKRIESAYPIVKPIDCYENLPYCPRFVCIVKPRLAGVSYLSLQSFTSSRNVSVSSVRFLWLRNSPLFYLIRDLINLKILKKYLELWQLARQGKLKCPEKKWIPLPSGRNIYPF